MSDSYCFTSAGAGAAVTEIPCPVTGLAEASELSPVFRLYSEPGHIAGFYTGQVSVHTLTGETVQVLSAAGSFRSQPLAPGIYMVTLGSATWKLVVR